MNVETPGGKQERPPATKPISEEAATARALEIMKKMKFQVTSPDFEKAFVADFIKRLEASGQEVIRSPKP